MDVLAAKASLMFWAQNGQGNWKLGDKQWQAIEPTFAYPDGVKSANYWQNLAAFNMLSGRVEEGRRVLAAHRLDKAVLVVFDAFARSVEGDCDGAQAIMDSLVTNRILNPESSAGVRFRIGMCHVAKGSYRPAIENFEKIVDPANFSIHNAPLIPKCYYQLGRAYEALGNAELARKNYERFLDIWKNADPDQREKADAASRLAVLRATGS
jgi:tetratricopeptide (TPR) repeat protein